MAEEINIKVKTLDSNVHEFTVPSNIPVLELKAKIAEKTNVPSNMQRIIFKGKVLHDDKDLSFYSVQDGHALHMVERPAQTDAPQTPQQPNQQQARPQPNSPPPQGAHFGPMLMGVGPSNVVVGTIGMEGPGDLNQIFNVLNTMGIGQPGGINAQNPNQPGEFEYIRNVLTNATNLVQNLTIGPAPTLPEAPNPPANSIEQLGQLLAQYNEQMRAVQPAIDRLSQLFRVESVLTDPQTRTETQQLASRMHLVLQQLGIVQNVLAGRLAGFRMNETAGSARLAASNVSVHIQPAGAHHHVHHAHAHAHAQAQQQAQAAAAAAGQQQGPPGSIPIFSVRQQAAPGNQPGQPAQPGQPGQPQQPFNIANLFTGILQATGAAVPNPQQQQQPNNGQPQFNNILNQIMASIQQPQQRPTQPQTAQAQQQQQQQQQGQQIPAEFGNMMSQMLSGLTNLIPQPGQPQPTQQPQQTPPQQPQQPAAPGAQPQQPGQPSQEWLSQMFNVVANAVSNPASTGGNSVASILRTVTAERPQDDGPLEDIIQVFLESITMPELLGVMHGNWEGVERAHAPVANYIRTTTLQGDASPERIRAFANEVTASLRDSVGETVLPQELITHVRPGVDLIGALAGILQGNVVSLFELLLATYTPTPTDPHPFAIRLRDWVRLFVRALVDGIAECMTGGVADAQGVVRRFLEQRLTFMGSVAPTGSMMITEYIMRTYYNSVAQNQAQPTTQPTSPQPTVSPTSTTTTFSFTSSPVITTTTTTTSSPIVSSPLVSSPLISSPPIVPHSPIVPTSSPLISRTPVPSSPTPVTAPITVAKPPTTNINNNNNNNNSTAPSIPSGPALSTFTPATVKPAAAPAPAPTTKLPSTSTDSTIPEDWLETMAEDEKQQDRLPKQNAFSDSYSSGSESKRRKALLALQKSNVGSNSLFQGRLQEALNASSNNNNRIDAGPLVAESGNLAQLYSNLVSQNIASRLRDDPDFDPTRFPNANAVFLNNNNNNNTTTSTSSTRDPDVDMLDEALNQF